MTNREYMDGLNIKEYVQYVLTEPWSEYATKIWKEGFYTYSEGVDQWMRMEKQKE